MGIVCIDILSTIAAQMAVKIILTFGLFFGIATGQGCEMVLHGGIAYTARGTEDTSVHGCVDDNVYEKEGYPGSKFCFKKSNGDSSLECLIKGNLKFETLNQDLVEVAVGDPDNGIWGVDKSKDVMFSKSNGTTWEILKASGPVPLKHVAVGEKNEVWAVDEDGTVHQRDGQTESTPSGNRWSILTKKPIITQMDVFGTQSWGVDENSKIHRLSRTGPQPVWQEVNEGSLEMISSGLAGVWGVNKEGTLYYRAGTCGERGTLGTKWQQSPSNTPLAKWVEVTPVGDDLVVWIVSTDGEIYSKTFGSCNQVPSEDTWTFHNTDFTAVQLNAGGKRVLVVDNEYNVHEAFL